MLGVVVVSLAMAGCGGGDTIQVAAIVTETVGVPVTVTARESNPPIVGCSVSPIDRPTVDLVLDGDGASELCDRWALNEPLVPSVPAGSWVKDDPPGRLNAIVCRKTSPDGRTGVFVWGRNFTDDLPREACAALARQGWVES